MELKQKIEQPLLSRTLVNGHVAFDGATPSNDKLAKDIASSVKSDPSLVVMKHVYSGFGKKEADFMAVVYKDVAARDRFEVKTKKAKDAEKKAQADAKAAAAAPKEEAK